MPAARPRHYLQESHRTAAIPKNRLAEAIGALRAGAYIEKDGTPRRFPPDYVARHIIGDQGRRNATPVGQGVHVRADPGGQVLVEDRFRVGQVARPEHRSTWPGARTVSSQSRRGRFY